MHYGQAHRPVQRTQVAQAKLLFNSNQEVDFDPVSFIDHATFENPYQASSGISNVLVNGDFVVFEGVLQPDSYASTRELRTPS